MKKIELGKLEAKLQKRGYRKYTRCLTDNESWAWFKTFDKLKDEDGEVISGYQVVFRVWDYTKYGQTDQNAFGLDFWTSPLGTDSRMDFTSNWEPICDFDTFELMAKDFHNLVKKYTNNNKKKQ